MGKYNTPEGEAMAAEIAADRAIKRPKQDDGPRYRSVNRGEAPTKAELGAEKPNTRFNRRDNANTAAGKAAADVLRKLQ